MAGCGERSVAPLTPGGWIGGMTRCVRPLTGGTTAEHPSRMRCDCEDRTGNGIFRCDRLM
jgi:hypothetical protein